MSQEAVFTMTLEPELRDAFMAAASAEDRPASQIVREFMQSYVSHDQDYLEFLRQKVERARQDIKAGRTFGHDEVMAEIDELIAASDDN